MTDNDVPLRDELEDIAQSFRRRQEQLAALQEKLRAAAACFAEDVTRVPLPQNPGAVLDDEPESMDMNDKETSQEQRSNNKSMQEAPPVPMDPAAPCEDAAPVPRVQRDSLAMELLNQSTGLVQRQEHLRISVENLDRKLDALAREMYRWREEDERRRLQETKRFLGMTRAECLRLSAMGFLFLVLVLVWHFLT